MISALLNTGKNKSSSVRFLPITKEKVTYYSYFIASMIASFYPLMLVVVFQVWAPTAMVQEVFSTNFLAYLLSKKYYFIETGYSFLVLFDFPISIIVNLFFNPVDNFQKYSLFSQLFYFYHGLVLLSIFLIINKSNISRFSKYLLLLIPLSPLCLERVTNLNLIINYCKGEEIFYLIFAFLCVKFQQSKNNDFFSKKRTLLFGSLAGYIVGIKFSLLLVAVPPILVLAVPLTRGFKKILEYFILFFVSFGLTFISILLCYLRFQPGNFLLFIKDLQNLYVGPWLKQKTPFLLFELGKFSSVSYYVGLQILVLLLISLYVGLLYLTIQNKDKMRFLFLIVFIVPFIVLFQMFWVRMSQGTMIDITLFTTFSLIVFISFIALYGKKHLTYILTVTMFLVFVFSLISFSPMALIEKLQKNSQTSREFELFLAHVPELKNIYYLPGLPQSVLFPSADLIGAYKVSGRPDFMSKYYPRFVSSNPDFLSVLPHVAIIPEYVNTIPITNFTFKEWPEMWPAVRTLEDNPALAVALKKRQTVCKIFQFIETQSRDQLLYYSTYPTKVMACIVQ